MASNALLSTSQSGSSGRLNLAGRMFEDQDEAAQWLNEPPIRLAARPRCNWQHGARGGEVEQILTH